jgi:hypothetical protein
MLSTKMYTFGGFSMLRRTIYFVKSRFRQVLNDAVSPSDFGFQLPAPSKSHTAYLLLRWRNTAKAHGQTFTMMLPQCRTGYEITVSDLRKITQTRNP